MFPVIDKPFLDIYTVSDYKLCVYSNCLIFGEPTLINYQLTFQANNYLKISEHHFLRFFDFFHNILQATQTVSLIEKNKEYQLISLNDSITENCVTYFYEETEDSTEPKIIIVAKYLTKLKFTFNTEEFYRFYLGFRNLCFKVYCYPIHIEEIIFNILKLKTIEYLEEFFETGYLSDYICDQILPQYEFILLKTILHRHQTLLVYIKKSFDFFLEQIKN